MNKELIIVICIIFLVYMAFVLRFLYKDGGFNTIVKFIGLTLLFLIVAIPIRMGIDTIICNLF